MEIVKGWLSFVNGMLMLGTGLFLATNPLGWIIPGLVFTTIAVLFINIAIAFVIGVE